MTARIIRTLTTTLAVALAAPLALAMPADQLKVTEYGKAGKWVLRKAVTADGKAQICDALLLSSADKGLRYEFTNDSTALAFIGLAGDVDDAGLEVKVWFDTDTAGAQPYTLSMEPDPTGEIWGRNYRSPNTEPDGFFDAFANAKTISVSYEWQGKKSEETYELSGSNGAVDKTITCVFGS